MGDVGYRGAAQLPRILRLRAGPGRADRPTEHADDVCFSAELVEAFLHAYTAPGGVVLDPFAGFGTTLLAAERLGRIPIGFEILPDRVSFVRSRLKDPAAVRLGDVRDTDWDLPSKADLCISSPPYMTRNDHPQNPLSGYRSLDGDYRQYLQVLQRIYAANRHPRLQSRCTHRGQRGQPHVHAAGLGPRIGAVRRPRVRTRDRSRLGPASGLVHPGLLPRLPATPNRLIRHVMPLRSAFNEGSSCLDANRCEFTPSRRSGVAGYGDRVISVLGIGVAADLRERWREWFAPSLQPFRAERIDAEVVRSMAWRRAEPTAEVAGRFPSSADPTALAPLGLPPA